MAPLQLKTYLETIVNSTLHPRDSEASLHDAYGNMDYGNALPIVCAMTTPSAELRREILEFGRFPEKFFLDLPADITPESFVVVNRVWRQRLKVFSQFLDKMEKGRMLEELASTTNILESDG